MLLKVTGVELLLAEHALVLCSWDQALEAPAGATPEQVGVPRWRPGLTFGEFAELTVRDYYPPTAPAGEGSVMHEGRGG